MNWAGGQISHSARYSLEPSCRVWEVRLEADLASREPATTRHAAIQTGLNITCRNRKTGISHFIRAVNYGG